MHASTRILLFLVALLAILGGWWLLLDNNTFIAAVIYGILWSAAVLIVVIVVLKIGFGYNRMRARRVQGSVAEVQAESALAELLRLRDAGLITTDEYEVKRKQILERL
jgi:hypothetical protein